MFKERPLSKNDFYFNTSDYNISNDFKAQITNIDFNGKVEVTFNKNF